MAATSTSAAGVPAQMAARRMRISHSAGRPGSGSNTGSDHFAGAAHGQRPQQVVEVGLLQGRQPGQDHVGVTRRLVDPVVHADHALEHAGARHRGARLPGALITGLPATVMRPLQLARDPGCRSPRPGTTPGTWPSTSGAPRDPAAPPAGAEVGQIGPGQTAHAPRHRLGEHQPAGRVEVPGQDVDHVDEPRRQRSELLIAQADPSVEHGPLRPGQLVSQRAGCGPRRCRRWRRPLRA